jgi:hypothetical protein
MTNASIVSSVPLDGSASVVVPFLQSFVQVCQSVVVQYTPVAPDSTVITTEVTAVSINGFTLTAYGGAAGTTGQFTYQAYGT